MTNSQLCNATLQHFRPSMSANISGNASSLKNSKNLTPFLHLLEYMMARGYGGASTHNARHTSSKV